MKPSWNTNPTFLNWQVNSGLRINTITPMLEPTQPMIPGNFYVWLDFIVIVVHGDPTCLKWEPKTHPIGCLYSFAKDLEVYSEKISAYICLFWIRLEVKTNYFVMKLLPCVMSSRKLKHLVNMHGCKCCLSNNTLHISQESEDLIWKPHNFCQINMLWGDWYI